MNGYIFVHPSFEQIAKRELEELLNIKAKIFPSVITFSAPKENFISLLFHTQIVRRILIALGNYPTIGVLDFEKASFPLADIFTSDLTFKVEVEGVKGQENRSKIAQEFSSKLFSFLEQKYSIKPKLQLRNPNITIIVFWNGTEYFCGIDVAGKELPGREYRIFPHSASFRGDAAYSFIRLLDFQPEKKLFIGFTKDGTAAIEAALFANRYPLFSLKQQFSFQQFPLFKELVVEKCLLAPTKKKIIIYSFDEALPNVIATRKNAALAGVKEFIDVRKLALDELDVQFAENEFDFLLFLVTMKDELKINELYYQANYILKPKGRFLIVGRDKWELPLSTHFKLLKKEVLERGNSKHTLWLLEKK